VGRPLARKLATYGALARLAARHGVHFSTCGCKDLRVRDAGGFVASCRNVLFLAGQPTARPGRSVRRLRPARAADGCR